LTDQLHTRFAERFGSKVAAIHSGMNDAARYRIWWYARQGEINIVLATRSGVFIEFKQLGLIIIDEEHDLSYKQHDGLRYHARSVAVKRAQLNNIPIVLGSATPSLETLHNVASRRYQSAQLHKRVGKSVLPDVECIDLNVHIPEDGISKPAISAMARALQQDHQVLVFINRRGYAPVLFCPACQWTAQCKRCDAQMTTHHQQNLQCHHCGARRALPQCCDACGDTGLISLGEGTQKIEQTLAELFPKSRIQRFDRDSLGTAKKLQSAMNKVHARQIDILVGTQLLSKGHDFSGVNLVLVLNADQGLHSIDFRAPEQLVQQLIQVAGRAGRGELKGKVLIQTQLPNHPALQAVRQHRYLEFTELELAQRKLAQFPPYTHIALWRARARDANQVMQFLHSITAIGRQCQPARTFCYDPVQSPMFKRGGQYHAQLLVSAGQRQQLHQWLGNWIPAVEKLTARNTKWSIDIDPMSLF
jgi:primosomal protein N' (replication factor Y)